MTLSRISLSPSSSLLSISTSDDESVEDSIVIMDCIKYVHNDEFDDNTYFKDLYEQYVNFVEEENRNKEKLARQLKDCRDEQHQIFLK